MKTTLLLTICGLAASLFSAACSTAPVLQSARTAPLPPADSDGNYRVVFPDEGRGAARYIRTTLGDDIAENCGLVRAHFLLDASDPLPGDKLFLKSVAECLQRPALRDKTLTIVGRADTHGNGAYNLLLGARRAQAVKQILVDDGVSADRIETSTRGDLGAVGGAGKLYSYGYDRRVDVILPAVYHAPR